MTTQPPWQATSLAYHAAQQCSHQWHDFMRVLVEELLGSAGDDEGLAFMSHLGASLAARHRLPESQTVETLESHINARWRDMNWGWCRLKPTETGILIEHGAWPEVLTDGDRWPHALSSFLEGAYGRWLREQGGGAVTVRCINATRGAPLELLYGI